MTEFAKYLTKIYLYADSSAAIDKEIFENSLMKLNELTEETNLE